MFWSTTCPRTQQTAQNTQLSIASGRGQRKGLNFRAFFLLEPFMVMLYILSGLVRHEEDINYPSAPDKQLQQGLDPHSMDIQLKVLDS